MQVEEGSLRAMWLSCNENKAFSVLISPLHTNTNATYNECKYILQEKSSGGNYKLTLQLILQSMKLEGVYTFFYEIRFPRQAQCFLKFLQFEPEMFLKCFS